MKVDTGKKATMFNLSLDGRQLLEAIAHGRGLTRTATIESLIREEAKRVKITLSTKEG